MIHVREFSTSSDLQDFYAGLRRKFFPAPMPVRADEDVIAAAPVEMPESFFEEPLTAQELRQERARNKRQNWWARLKADPERYAHYIQRRKNWRHANPGKARAHWQHYAARKRAGQ